MRRRTAELVIALIAVIALAGCGQRQTNLQNSAPRPLRVAVIPPNAGEAAIYGAQKTGAFKLAGLALTLNQAADPAAAIKQVASGQADLAVGTSPELLEARDRGARVQSVAALVQAPLASFIALKQGTAADVLSLVSKPIGTLGRDYQAAYAQTIFQKAHGHAKIVDVASNPVGALVSRKVAALVGAYSNAEGVDLSGHGRKPRVIPVNDLGVPPYEELVLVANENALTRDGNAIRSFVGALARTTHELRLAAPGPVNAWIAADSKAGAAEAKAALAITLPLTVPPTGGPFGFQKAQDWNGFGRWMLSHKLVKTLPAGSYTDAYLPGEGL